MVTVVDSTPAIIYYLHFAGSSMYSRTTCILQVDGESGRMSTNRVAWRNLALLAVLCAASRMQAQDAKQPYPRMAPIEQYRMDRDAEVALARTAAPASISKDAEVLVMGPKNYETAVEGKNGFVCLVGRAWLAPFGSPEFWNPKNRSPECFNPPAALSVLPYVVKTTGMVLAGFSKTQIFDGIKAAVDKKELGAPASGSLIYMMSKEAYLTDQAPHNLDHLMFDLPRMDGAAWGANLDGAPIFFQQFDPAPITEFYVVMSEWSDGTPVNAGGNSANHSHKH
jgi:hypothetical protein